MTIQHKCFMTFHYVAFTPFLGIRPLSRTLFRAHISLLFFYAAPQRQVLESNYNSNKTKFGGGKEEDYFLLLLLKGPEK